MGKRPRNAGGQTSTSSTLMPTIRSGAAAQGKTQQMAAGTTSQLLRVREVGPDRGRTTIHAEEGKVTGTVDEKSGRGQPRATSHGGGGPGQRPVAFGQETTGFDARETSWQGV